MAKRQPVRKVSLEEGVALLELRFAWRLAPPLEGLAYRFTIWLPVQAQGRAVFSEVQQKVLFDLFLACFGGYSQSRLEGFPPWSGTWLPQGAKQPVVDDHILIILYTLQHPDATICLRQLKWILQQEHVAAKEVVLIEQIPVHLIETAELT